MSRDMLNRIEQKVELIKQCLKLVLLNKWRLIAHLNSDDKLHCIDKGQRFINFAFSKEYIPWRLVNKYMTKLVAFSTENGFLELETIFE